MKIQGSAKPEFFHDRGRDPALFQIRKIFLRVPRIEVVEIETRRIPHERAQSVLFLLFLRKLFGILFVERRNFQPRTVAENAHRLHKFHVFVFLDKGNDVARSAATEAVVVLVRRVDRERRRLFMVKGTARPIIISLSFQFYIGTDHVRDLVFVLDERQKFGKTLFHTAPSLGSYRLRKSEIA